MLSFFVMRLERRCAEKHQIIYKTKKPDSCESGFEISWRPQGDLNPCRRRERPVSWARLDDGDAS